MGDVLMITAHLENLIVLYYTISSFFNIILPNQTSIKLITLSMSQGVIGLSHCFFLITVALVFVLNHIFLSWSDLETMAAVELQQTLILFCGYLGDESFYSDITHSAQVRSCLLICCCTFSTWYYYNAMNLLFCFVNETWQTGNLKCRYRRLDYTKQSNNKHSMSCVLPSWSSYIIERDYRGGINLMQLWAETDDGPTT